MLDQKQHKLLMKLNDTIREYPKDTCFHELFEQQARLSPNAIAVIHEKDSLTYSELSKQSTKLAKYLQRQGVTPDTLVAICMHRSLDMVISLLGIFKANCAYIPLDPAFPGERLEYMLRDSNASFLITNSYLKEEASQWTKNLNQIILIDEDWDKIEEVAVKITDLNQTAQSHNLAYVIYTSGSTGKPKGVMISHQSLVNFLTSMVELLGIDSSNKFLAVTTICFDIAALELYLPLLVGARCYICNSEKMKNVDLLKNEIKLLKPTYMQATPSTWSMLFQTGWKNEEKVKILCGGEALPESLKQNFIKTNSEAFNLYGPTETTIWSTAHCITKNSPANNIGKPISNTEVYILDEHQKLLPVGVVGEICIAGDGLARGYLNQAKLTEGKFISHPFRLGARLYRTGDLGRWLKNGTLECLGRIDHQVKLRGFRIELLEIEKCLDQHPNIQSSVIVVKEHKNHKQLVAYYILKRGRDRLSNDALALKKHLEKLVPDYMIPAIFIQIDKMPLTMNGKIDRKALASGNIDLRPNIETQLLEIWMDLLGIKIIDTTSSFFDIGGNSVLAATLVEEIKGKLDPLFSVTKLFKYNTIEKISEYLKIKNQINDFELTQERKNNSDNRLSAELIFKDRELKINKNFDVAVIGITGKFPLANGIDEFWNNIVNSKNCITEIPPERWSWQEMYGNPGKESNRTQIKWGGFIEGIWQFDPLFFGISPREAELMDPQQRLLLTYAWLALENAGIAVSSLSRQKTGVFVAATPNNYPAQIASTPENNPYILTSSFTSMIPNRISHLLDLCGPSECCEATCSSSIVALHRAIQAMHYGECNQAIVGAINLLLSPREFIAYEAMGLLSLDKNVYSFQEQAHGYVRSEGVVVVVIKPLDEAIKDNDIIYAVIKGTGVSHGGKGMSLTSPNEDGIKNAITQAYEAAGVNPLTISYIEAHGTAAPLGDGIEIAAIKSAYQQIITNFNFSNNQAENHKCYLSSLKPSMGHGEIVSGMAALVKVIMSMRHKIIPGVPNFTLPHKNVLLDDSPFRITEKNQRWETLIDEKGNKLPRRASINSYGFGVNAHMVVEEYSTVEGKHE